MQIKEFIQKDVFFNNFLDTTTQEDSGDHKQNYGETNGYLKRRKTNFPNLPK